MTNEARAESSSLELCLARRNSTKSNPDFDEVKMPEPTNLPDSLLQSTRFS